MEQLISDLGLIIGISLMYASPLILTSLGGTISENSGVINIGLEGMMSLGAFTAAGTAYLAGTFWLPESAVALAPWIGFLAGGISSMGLAALHGLATVKFGADHVVSGIAMNFVGPGMAFFISRLVFEGATQTPTVPAKLPKVFGNVFESNSFFDLVLGQQASVYVALIMVALVWFYLYKTVSGSRLRAAGEHPEAAASLGLRPERYRFGAVLASGFFAGLGGGAMSIAVVSQFSPSLISGQGFIALAAMIFGKWKPQGALLACLFFGLAQGLSVFFGRPGFGIPSQFLAMLPYVLTLIVLVGFVGRANAPAALGQKYTGAKA